MIKKTFINLCLPLLWTLGCQDKQPKESEIPIVLEDTTFTVKKSLSMIDFYAIGNEPFWSINSIEDSIVYYSDMANQDTIVFEWEEPQQIGGIQRFTLENRNYRLSFDIRPDSCRDTMSGQTFSHVVQATLIENSEVFKTRLAGCGSYVPDYRLTGAWQLNSLSGNVIQHENGLKQTPQVTLKPFDGSFSGNAGCNSISGTIVIENDHLFFSNIRTTRMACPSPLEEELIQVLGTVNRYEISGNYLTLFRGTEKSLTWKRTIL